MGKWEGDGGPASKLPLTGAFVIALPMKIYGGSGGPLRIVAWKERGE